MATMDSAMDFPRARQKLQRGVEEGLHYGAQLAVCYDGQMVHFSVGEVADGKAMTSDHVLCWSSSVKPLMSIALGQLQEKGLVDFDDPVSKFLPSFAAAGKASVTLRHCLTHTAGLWASMFDGSKLREDASCEEVLRHVCQQPLVDGWQPGKRCGYDSPAWYVLAGVVTAADPRGRSYPDYVEEEIFAPLGLENCSIGFSPARRAKLEEAGLIAPLYLRTKKPWNILPEESKPQRVNYPCPAGNGRGPAKELCAIYASLLPVAASADNATARLLRPETVEQLTAVARRGLFDELQGVDTDWSLGFAVNCILSGRHASDKAYGHGGSQSSWAFADPQHQLSVACLCNGKPGPEQHYRRVGEVSTAIYEDLGLADVATRSFALPRGLGTF